MRAGAVAAVRRRHPLAWAGALLLSLLAPAARAGPWTWAATLAAHLEYLHDDDLFGGSYAPFHPSLGFSAERGSRVRLEASLDGYRDLSADAGFRAEMRSLYLEVGELPLGGRARLGRFPRASGFGWGFLTLDGGDLRLRPRADTEVDLFAGRNHVPYDLRFAAPWRVRAPYSDTGVVLGGEVAWRRDPLAEASVGLSSFDPGGGRSRESWLLYGLAGDLGGLRLDLRGYQGLTSDSGAEVHVGASHAWASEAEARVAYDRIRPDRRNPEIVTSVFVADAVDRFGAGVSLPVGERLEVSAGWEGYAFEAPGGPDRSRRSDAARAGVRLNHWTDRGFEAAVDYRFLTGEAGRLHEIAASGEKRLAGWASLGFRVDLAHVRRDDEESETENAYILAGTARVRLLPGLWLLWELEDYHNLDFDYNLRTRLTVEYRLSDEGS